VKAVHHTGIIVSDLDRSLDFYVDVLGLGIASEPSPVFDDPGLGEKVGVPGANLRQVNLVAGDDVVELLEYTRPASPHDAPVPQNTVGAHHVGFVVDDIEAKVRELEGKGVRFLSAVNAIDEGVLAGWRWVYFTDPDGITLELVEIAYERPEERKENIAAFLASRERGAARELSA